jgi:hypothetical protein
MLPVLMLLQQEVRVSSHQLQPVKGLKVRQPQQMHQPQQKHQRKDQQRVLLVQRHLQVRLLRPQSLLVLQVGIALSPSHQLRQKAHNRVQGKEQKLHLHRRDPLPPLPLRRAQSSCPQALRSHRLEKFHHQQQLKGVMGRWHHPRQSPVVLLQKQQQLKQRPAVAEVEVRVMHQGLHQQGRLAAVHLQLRGQQEGRQQQKRRLVGLTRLHRRGANQSECGAQYGLMMRGG